MDKSLFEKVIVDCNITLRKWRDDSRSNLNLFNHDMVRSVILSWLNKAYIQYYQSKTTNLGWRERKSYLREISGGLSRGIAFSVSEEDGLHISNITITGVFSGVALDFPELDYNALNKLTNDKYVSKFSPVSIEAISFRAIEQVKFN